ncbi:hypothetical protein MUO66_09610, partial [Candidatus Bathyarchaeota archaeon]|nr:hypothetical protein [Candidatus Bathyarchaeota archaeon]
GLGFWGFTGGLLAMFDQPTFGGVIEILTVTIFVVWGVNTGDKIAEKIPKNGSEIFKDIRHGPKIYTTIQLPNECLIFDIASKPKVPPSLKTELSEREFTLPSDLPMESIIKRVKRRLITDWGIGDIELELNQNKKVIYLAISAKEAGLSVILPKEKIAIPIECAVLPSKLVIGDYVTIFLDNKEVIERIEVNGIDEINKVITIFSDREVLEKIRGSKAKLVIALPISVPKPPVISVEHKSGSLEEFKIQKILDSLNKIGVDKELANEIVRRVKIRLHKMDPPVSTATIKKVIINELKKDDPEAAKMLNKHKIWQ